jgi:cytochrome c556
MKRTSILALLALVGLLASSGLSQQRGDNRQFMRAKLDHAQQVLEGLSLEDFDAIAKHGQELSLLSLAASWQVLETTEYQQQSLEFRRAADALTAAARKKNLDGAALAYVEMTMKCVSCHKYMRKVRMARLEAPSGNQPERLRAAATLRR